MAGREQPYDPYIPAGNSGQGGSGMGHEGGNTRTAAIQSVSSADIFYKDSSAALSRAVGQSWANPSFVTKAQRQRRGQADTNTVNVSMRLRIFDTGRRCHARLDCSVATLISYIRSIAPSGEGQAVAQYQ